MLSKCANPECSAHFHYYGQGKLFEVFFEDAELCRKAGRVDVPAMMKKHPQGVERFWLCTQCSETLTVAVDRSNNVKLLPLSRKPESATARVQHAAAS